MNILSLHFFNVIILIGSSFGWDRFSSFGSRTDYKLEKVKAFMATEDQDPKLRENRAYSTGCNPSKPTSSFQPDLPAAVHSNVTDSFRIRAYSLGNHAASSPTSGRAVAGSSSRPGRGLVHSPSAAMVLGHVSGGALGAARNVVRAGNNEAQSTSDGSGRTTPSTEGARKEGSTRAEDLMELTFRPRSR